MTGSSFIRGRRRRPCCQCEADSIVVREEHPIVFDGRRHATLASTGSEATNLIAAAEEMPAEKYAFRPTAEQMTFAKLMTHRVESNRYMCSGIEGAPLPKETSVTDADAKATIVAD